ncbi:hypothetical protein [Methylobacterium nonmethylotrophicum]|uniref:hypothetical protein n=1 Tax=Methylobacterium nonmethylotrophicum TaxID=1141884 RepID=UPI00197CA3D3|nr:hypothetical protein [Methylobacterium nonmethylotrophicum]
MDQGAPVYGIHGGYYGSYGFHGGHAGYYGGYRGHHGHYGGGLAAGLIGGLALGTLSAATYPYGYGYDDGF